MHDMKAIRQRRILREEEYDAVNKEINTTNDPDRKVRLGHKADELLAEIEHLDLQIEALSKAPAESEMLTLPETIPAIANLPAKSWMPFRPNPLFIGRDPELQQLAAMLRTGKSSAITTGIGGVGKSSLAIEFVHRFGQFFSGGVFWLNFEDPQRIESQIIHCGGREGMQLLGFEEQPDRQLVAVQTSWLLPIARLLVFDNCEIPALIERYKPITGGCRVIITSRNAIYPPTLDVKLLELDLLPRAQSIALLRSYYSKMLDDEADALAKTLGDLPLALHVAGSYLKTYSHVQTISDYLKQLTNTDILKHPSLQGRGAKSKPTPGEVNIDQVFRLSFERLNRDDPIDIFAIKHLARASLLAPNEPFPVTLLFDSLPVPPDDLDERLARADGLRRLKEVGLIESKDPDTLQLHRLLCAFAQQVAFDDSALNDVEQAMVETAYRINEAGHPSDMQAIWVHLRFCTDRALKREDEQAATLAANVGRYLQLIWNLQGARPYLERALAIREALLGPMHPAVAQSLNNLGVLLQNRGDMDEAQACLVRALAIREQIFGEQHPDTALSQTQLGAILQAQGDLQGAKLCYQRALSIYEGVLGSREINTVQSLDYLGFVLQELGEWKEAQLYLEKALSSREQMFGVRHPDVAQTLNNLGVLLQKQGDLPKAQSYLERALAIREGIFGPEHPDVAQTLNNLGVLLRDQKAFESARQHYERALDIFTQTIGESHPHTAQTLDNLGILLQVQGKLAEARPYLEQALAIWERVLKRTDLRIAASLNNLGTLLRSMGDLRMVRNYYERALAIREQVLGEQHADTAVILNNIGFFLQIQEDLKGAQSAFERALSIREQVLGEQHPDTAVSLNNLGYVLRLQGDTSGARSCYERALAIYKQLLGVQHLKSQAIIKVLQALNN